jgi:hypothetical protein
MGDMGRMPMAMPTPTYMPAPSMSMERPSAGGGGGRRNSWNDFQREHGGQGYSRDQIREMYHSRGGG